MLKQGLWTDSMNTKAQEECVFLESVHFTVFFKCHCVRSLKVFWPHTSSAGLAMLEERLSRDDNSSLKLLGIIYRSMERIRLNLLYNMCVSMSTGDSVM